MSKMSSTEVPALSFKKDEDSSKKFIPPTNKIGWITTKADKPGAKFDLVISDIFGHVIVQKNNCGNETDRYGELVNVPVMMGQEINISVKNVKGAEKVDLFLN